MPRDSLLLQTVKLLSQRLAAINEFYNVTACLHPVEREIIGYCYAYIALFGEQDELSVFLLEEGIPAILKIGIAKWPRTELTDLGLAISNKDTEEVTLVPIEEDEMLGEDEPRQ